MTGVRLAWVAALSTAAVWAAKAIAIAAAGGLDRSPLEGPLVLLGFAVSLVAVAALAVVVMSGRPLLVRVLAAVVAMVAWFFVLQILDAAIGTIQPTDPGWVWEEISLWVGALLLVGVASIVRNRVEERVPVG